MLCSQPQIVWQIGCEYRYILSSSLIGLSLPLCLPHLSFPSCSSLDNYHFQINYLHPCPSIKIEFQGIPSDPIFSLVPQLILSILFLFVLFFFFFLKVQFFHDNICSIPSSLMLFHSVRKQIETKQKLRLFTFSITS